MATNRENAKLAFRGSQLKLSQVADGAQYVSLEITAAAPPVLTITGSQLKSGDVIHIKGTGDDNVDTYFAVQANGSNSFTLPDVDFSGVDTEALKNAQFAVCVAQGFCMATSFDVTPASVDYEATSTICDNYAQEEGEVGAGEASAEAYWNPDNPVLSFLKKTLFNQQPYYLQDKPKGSNIITGRTVKTSSFSRNGSVGDKWQASVGWKFLSREQEIDGSK